MLSPLARPSRLDQRVLWGAMALIWIKHFEGDDSPRRTSPLPPPATPGAGTSWGTAGKWRAPVLGWLHPTDGCWGRHGGALDHQRWSADSDRRRWRWHGNGRRGRISHRLDRGEWRCRRRGRGFV